MRSAQTKTKSFNNLNWRAKTLGFLIGAAVVFVGLVIVTQKVVVLPRIESAEFAYYARIGNEISARIVRRERALSSLADTLAERPTFAAPTEWDLRSAAPGDDGWEEMGVLRPALVAVFDETGQAIKVWHPKKGIDLPSEMLRPVLGPGVVTGNSPGSGALSTQMGMILYAKAPYGTARDGKPSGMLIVCERLRRPPVSEFTDLGPVRGGFIDAEQMAKKLPGERQVDSGCLVAPDGDSTMVTRVALRDDLGRIVGGIEVRSERLVRLVQITSMRLTIAVMLISTLVLSLVIWIVVERVYVRRIERLIDLVGRLDDDDAIDALVHFQGSDEVGQLARKTGGMVRTLNEARELAEVADTAKMNFLAMMSHELRTPMNGVIGFAGLLRETQVNAEQLDYVRIIESSGRAILKQIDEILHYAMISTEGLSLDERPVKVREMIAEAGRTVSQELGKKHLTYREDVDAGVPRILWLDRDRVGQILGNLLENAVKFTREGGVVVEAVVGEDPESGERRLQIAVTDTGVGIAKEHQARLFRPFSQVDTGMNRRFGGAGLGLAISQRIAQAMGGRITVASQVGKGSTFIVLLPLKDAETYAGKKGSSGAPSTPA